LWWILIAVQRHSFTLLKKHNGLIIVQLPCGKEAGKEMAATIPGAKLVIIKGMEHDLSKNKTYHFVCLF
jgi:hypothetical protein